MVVMVAVVLPSMGKPPWVKTAWPGVRKTGPGVRKTGLEQVKKSRLGGPKTRGQKNMVGVKETIWWAKSVRNLRRCLNARRVSWWLAHGRSGSMLRSPGTLARAMPRTARWHQDGSRTQSWDENLANIQKLLQISCSKMSKQSWKSSGVTNLEKHVLLRSKVQESKNLRIS